MSRHARNGEGMTFAAWFAAATFGAPPERLHQIRQDGTLLSQYRRAWRAGEDPTEHAVGGA